MRSFCPRLKAFSLLECCFFLLIVGIVISSLTPLISKYMDAKKRVLTRERQEYALRLIAAYAQTYQSLPAPALPEDGKSTKTNRGVLPYVTLGMDPEQAKDGYGYFMSYAVAALDDRQKLLEFSKKKYASLPLFIENARGERILYDENPSKSTDPKTNPVVVVLISHGPTGAGALKHGDERYPIPSPPYGVDKRNNADGRQFTARMPQKKGTDGFDDEVVWATHLAVRAKYAL